MSAKEPKPPGSGNYEVGYGKPPVRTRFRKGQSGKPRKTDFLKEVIEYKADAEREIERRGKLGIADISDIDPHPDDLLVDMATGEVYVKGELNPKDIRMLKGLGLKR